MSQMLFQARGRKPLHLLILAAVITLCYLGLRERWLPATPEDNSRTNRYPPPRKDYSGIKPLRPERYPPGRITPLPSGKAVRLPRVQHQFAAETSGAKAERERRASAVRDAFSH